MPFHTAWAGPCLARAVLVAVATLALASCSPDVAQLVQTAKEARAKGDRDAAIIALKNALQKNSANAEARYLLGTLYNEARDGQSAEKELRQARDLGASEGGRVVAELARALLLQNQYAKIVNEIKPAESFENGPLATVHAIRGRAQLLNRAFADARVSYGEAVKAEAENADTMILAFLLKLAERDKAGAMALIDRTVERHPDKLDAWMLKADLLREDNKLEETLAVYQKLLTLNPKLIPALVARGSLYLSMGKPGEAQKDIDAIRAISKRNVSATYLQALLQFQASKYREAQISIQQVLKVFPGHRPSLLLDGSIHYALGSFVKAEQSMTQYLRLDPQNVYARKLLAATLLELKEGKRALEVIEPALGKEMADVTLAALAGDAHVQLREFSRAAEFLEKAAALDPKNADLRMSAALSRLATGDLDRAVTGLEAATRLDSKLRADYTLVTTLLNTGNFDKALQAVDELEKKMPNTPITYNLRGVAYLGKRDPAKARTNFERALSIDPTFTPAAGNLAELDAKDGKADAARTRFQAVLAKDGKNVRAMTGLAQVEAARGNRAEALKLLEQAVKIAPNFLDAQLPLIDLYLQAGKPKEALSSAMRAQAAMPDSLLVLDALGMAQLANNELSAALATFNKMVSLDPRSLLAHYRLASVKASLNDVTGARASLNAALKIDPDFPGANEALAGMELGQGQPAKAMEIARRLQKRHPGLAVGYEIEGDVLMAQKNYPQALKVYQAASQKAPSGTLTAKTYMAEARTGNIDGGIKRLDAWISGHPDDLTVRTLLAEAQLLRGQPASAIGHYEYIVKRLPNDARMQNNLANAYQAAKDPRALETAEKAYKIRPSDPIVADTLAWILVEQGKIPRALQLLSAAVEKAPEAPVIRYHLAAALAQSGDKARARKELEQLIASGVKFRELEDARNLLKQL